MQTFLAELSSQGFHPTQIILDGKIHRFERNGSSNSAWYIGWQNHTVKDGSQYIVAEYGDWKTGERHLYKPDASKLSTVDKQAIKAQLDESKRKADEEKRIRQHEASIKAEKYWASAKSMGSTPYMEKKKIDELYGSRVHEGMLQIPVRDIEGKLWGLQYISNAGKRFLTGTKVDSCFHTIGDINGELLLCEGFATGASIHSATGKTTVVCFNAGNLVSVAKVLKIKYPDLLITVCGDDDRFTVDRNGEKVNAGRDKGDKAAMMAHGTVVYPIFESDEGKPTDFNDLHCREGLEKVRQQICCDESETKAGYIPLGYDESTFFFYHIPSKDIVKVNSFSKVQMYQISPADYWAEKYPTKHGDADLGAAANDLIQMSKVVGPFDSTRIRGTGVWMDEDRVVVNLGHKLIVDGKELSLNAIRSWYIYIQTRNRLPPMVKPLSVEECRPLLDACIALKWRDSKAGYLLAGWLFNARIAGALSIHPHVWLTGGSGTGKSTVMDRLVAPALGCHKGKIYLQGSSTEAGIRQRMKCSSVPTIFDEFETTGEGSKERVGNLVELLRNTWSATQGVVVKGSTSGVSVEYSLQFSALVSSIRVNLENDADRSRFSVLELAPHDNNLKHWSFVSSCLEKINENFGERLFARSASMVRVVRRSQDIIARALAGKVNQRYGQQVGTILAGWYALTSDNVITTEIANSLVRELDLVEEKEEFEMTDEMECFNHLMGWKILVRHCNPMGGNETKEMSIGTALLSSEYGDQVKNYGVKCIEGKIYVADVHPELTKIYSRTRWSCWRLSLRRIDGANKEGTSRFGSTPVRSTSLPISMIKDTKDVINGMNDMPF